MTLLNDFLSLVYPNICQVCSKSLFKNEKIICMKCRHHLPYTHSVVDPSNPAAQIFWGRVPAQLVAKAPAPRLSAREQQTLARAKKKIAAIKEDLVNARGLTRKEVDVAAKMGLIDPDQKYWWTEEWQKDEREAERDIRAGRVETFETPEEFRKALQSL